MILCNSCKDLQKAGRKWSIVWWLTTLALKVQVTEPGLGLISCVWNHQGLSWRKQRFAVSSPGKIEGSLRRPWGEGSGMRRGTWHPSLPEAGTSLCFMKSERVIERKGFMEAFLLD